MNAVVYLPPKVFNLFKNATLIESSKVADNEILLVNSDSTIDAALGGKSQIPLERACIKYIAKEENLKSFTKTKPEKKEDKEEDEVPAKKLNVISREAIA